MIQYFETTTFIVGWVVVLSWLWAECAYRLVTRRPGARLNLDSRKPLIPALVLAPVVLVGAYQLFELNLIFPVRFFSNPLRTAAVALAPGLVLLVASGLAPHLTRQIAAEYDHWSRKTFSRTALSFGRSPSRMLRPLVLAKSLSESWLQCAPWLFGELIIVESIFNAPGLGLDAWHLAKVRDYGGLAQVLVWLFGLYGAFVAAGSVLNGWIGRKLESYS